MRHGRHKCCLEKTGPTLPSINEKESSLALLYTPRGGNTSGYTLGFTS